MGLRTLTLERLTLLALTGALALACAREEPYTPPPFVPTPPAIVVQPADAAVQECGSAAFSVQATGSPPLEYLWYVDGVPISGAGGQIRAKEPTHVSSRVGLGSNGQRFQVKVRNAGGEVMSREAVLSVAPASSPVLIVDGHVSALATDGTDVYWTDGTGVRAADVACESAVRTLYQRYSEWETILDMALAPGRVVWVNYLLGDVRTSALDGSGTFTLSEAGGSASIFGLTATGMQAYWAGQGGIHGAPLLGGAVTHPVSSTLVYELAADENDLYWYDVLERTLRRLPLTVDASPATLISALQHPAALALDGSFVYWSDITETPSHGWVGRIAREGGEPQILAEHDGGVGRMVVDGAYLYWTGGTFDGAGNGFLARVRVDGSAGMEVLATGLDLPFHLAMGARHVYFGDRAGIWRYDRPAEAP